MAEFISNVAMIAALYFMVAIVLPKKIMFFFPENLQKRKYAILGMFVAFILGAIAYSNTNEGITASSNAEKEQKESIAGSKEWYDKLISVASRDSAQLSRIKDFEDKMEDTLKKLGFKRVMYKWVDADVEYTYYDL